MRLFKVNQAARELGYSETFLRKAEQHGKIPKAKRDANGWRYYTQEDIMVLRQILLPNLESNGDLKNTPSLDYTQQNDDNSSLPPIPPILSSNKNNNDPEKVINKKSTQGKKQLTDEINMVIEKVKKFFGDSDDSKIDTSLEKRWIREALEEGFSIEDIYDLWEKKQANRPGEFVHFKWVFSDLPPKTSNITRSEVKPARESILFAEGEPPTKNIAASQIWQAVLQKLKPEVKESNYHTWLERTIGIDYKNNIFYIQTDNDSAKEYLEKYLHSIIEKNLMSLTNDKVKVLYVTKKQ